MIMIMIIIHNNNIRNDYNFLTTTTVIIVNQTVLAFWLVLTFDQTGQIYQYFLRH